ncbi:MAG: bifunctional ADP-dependent NAD(P)H-hydrate dehydratase/NAD(P)H-hydrate epimerase, partial [Aquificaceae bacterium]|nr:bifunctional ADP-dependent NAD(P)H-hydrate dehydratase/NAD(P)H-hydrate epimerase [Aquificaceae bacterium]
PEGKVFLSVRGTPAMAKGGMGDVLSGVLLALMGRAMPTEEALKLGVFLHGLAGEVAERKRHRESLKALDLVEAIPEAYNLIENETFDTPFPYIP